jgi:hypothetical protein
VPGGGDRGAALARPRGRGALVPARPSSWPPAPAWTRPSTPTCCSGSPRPSSWTCG